MIIQKRSLLLAGLLCTLEILDAQPRPVPAAYSSAAPVNYIRTWDAIKPTTDQAGFITSSTPTVARMTTQYFDGLGRPIQTVAKQGSLITGGSAKDITTTTLYDDQGLVSYQYLPSPANNTGGNTHIDDGMLKLNPFEQQAAFYGDPNGVLKGQGETYFYGYTKYEASPLNRVEEVFAPGNNWMGTSGQPTEAARKSVKTKYYINTATDAVRIWKVTNNATIGNWGSYSSPGAYPAGELYKNVNIDEAGHQVIEFKDKEGQVILKKVQLTAAADTGAGSSHAGWLCTYYIYDDLGQLRCVIQPRGVELISSNWLLTDVTILAEQCFRYEYDERQRMIVKKVPGAGEVNMVYDKRDRLAMTQDANLKLAGQWLVTKYDVLNRPIETGLWNNATTAATHRDNASSVAEGQYEYPTTTGIYDILTQSYYDNYDWVSGSPITNSNYETNWDTYLLPASLNDYPYPVANVKSDMTRGMITGSKTKILGTNDYLYTMLLYDDKGRVIQTKSTNATGGTDVATTQYGWQGLPLVAVQKQQKSGSNTQTITIVTKNNYDDLGRVVKVEKRQAHSQYNSGAMSAYKTISQMEYDALGQVKQKKLAPEYDNNAGLETIAYDYNIRGWLLGANRDYIAETATPADKHFGFDLGYDKKGALDYDYLNKQYNGNISGTIWRSAGDGEKRKYDYSYDAANRLMLAFFGQYNSSNKFSNDKVNYNAKMGDGANPNTAYDANGNIKLMYHYGLKINSSEIIDKLTYTYQPKSNKLAGVVDTYNDEHSTLGDFKYDPLTKGSTDYTYDANGNLISDANKNISGITYNYLNLPSVITVTGKGTITYTYDAAGNKLKKETVDNTVSPSKTTTTLYLDGVVYENDVLQFAGYEEGRIRPVRDVNNNITGFVYDYFLKDHLGNIRMVLTEEQKQDLYPLASMETSKVAIEKNYYDIQDANIVDKSVATGITNYQNNNGISNNPPDPSFENTNSQKLYKLNSNGTKTGLGITLKVMAGDKIDVFGKSYYFQNTSGQSGNSTIPILDLLTAFLGSPSSPVSAHGLTAEALNIPAGILGINSLIANQSSQSNASPNKPRAFINVIFFDEQFKSYSYKASMVGAQNVVKDHYAELQNITADKSGYVFIYCSNESPVNVFFDNLQVVHTRGTVLEENHYYPFGLVQDGISTKALNFGDPKNKEKTFQGQRFDDELGLNWVQFKWRNHDPQIGRFIEIDPLSEKYAYYSTYAFSENKVTGHVELEGLEAAPTEDKRPYPARVPAANTVGNVAKGFVYGLNGRYQIEPVRGSTVTGIRDTKARVNETTGKAKGIDVVRVDEAHGKGRSAIGPHININPEATGISKDPHIPLTSTQFKVLKTAGQVLNGIDKVAKPVAIVTDAIQLGNAIKTDIQQGTGGDNTIVTGSRVAGGWAGAWGGAQVGVAIGAGFGSLFGPGPGTAMGGLIGGIIGGIGGAIFGSEVGETAGEKVVEIKNGN